MVCLQTLNRSKYKLSLEKCTLNPSLKIFLCPIHEKVLLPLKINKNMSLGEYLKRKELKIWNVLIRNESIKTDEAKELNRISRNKKH